MGMQREFHVTCDICHTVFDEAEWYASEAIISARSEGWLVQEGSNLAVCDECQEQGYTLSDARKKRAK